MRDPSSYTVVGLGANARDETVFLEKRVSYVTAIIQSAFGHLPESHKDVQRFLRKRVVGQTLPDSGPLPQKGAQCRFNADTHQSHTLFFFFVFFIWDPKNYIGI